ncbi:MAG: hypothetical protein ACR2IK_05385 [Chloroflexota bacterium]
MALPDDVGGRQQSYGHPHIALVLFALRYFCWLFLFLLFLAIAFGHMPTRIAQPMMTALGIVSAMIGLVYWAGAADDELRDLAPGAIWGGLACLVGAQVAGYFAR